MNKWGQYKRNHSFLPKCALFSAKKAKKIQAGDKSVLKLSIFAF